MRYIKTYESLPVGQSLYNTKIKDITTYFNKENRTKRSDIDKLVKTIKGLIDTGKMDIDNHSSLGRGNTIIKSNNRYKYWIDILDDLSIDVYGDVAFSNCDFNRLPFKFNEVKGNFNMKSCYKLDDFTGFPIKVGGDMKLESSGLDTLIGLPTKEVGKDFSFNSNNIQTLEGCPQVGGSIDAGSNDIYTLEFLPKKVKFGNSYWHYISLYLNPIQNIKFHSTGGDSTSLPELLLSSEDTYNLFMDYDPIRPPEIQFYLYRPIIVLDALEMFAKELDMTIELPSVSRFNKDYKVVNSKDL